MTTKPETPAEFVKRVRAVCEKATGSPWIAECLNDDTDRTSIRGPEFGYMGDAEVPVEADRQAQIHSDAVAIAEARTDLPQALELLGEATGLLVRMTTPGRGITKSIRDTRAFLAGQKGASP